MKLLDQLARLLGRDACEQERPQGRRSAPDPAPAAGSSVGALGHATSTSLCARLRPSVAADGPRPPTVTPQRRASLRTRGIGLGVVVAPLVLQGCVNATVDEMTFLEPGDGIGDASVVILGRRHAPDYETEFEFIDCVADHIRRGDKSITVLPEVDFVNSLYPWFEPRTAPLRTEDIDKLLSQKPVAEKLTELKLEYMVWIDGSTIETNSSGSMTCGVGPGGAGCFGFGTWGNASDYEATIWDFTDRTEVGRISANTSGQSYMPAVVVPIPIIAPVQGAACDSLGGQLLRYLSADH